MTGFDTDLALLYLAAGFLAELLNVKHATPGERIGSIGQVILVSIAIGVVMPLTDNRVEWALVIPAAGRVLGKVSGDGVDFLRLKRVMRQDGTTRGKQAESPGD